MPPTSADNKGRGRDRGKGKVHHSRSTVMKVAGKVTHADNNNPPTSADTSADDIALTIKHSKSRVKSRPKTGNKRSSKHQGRPKSSRQSLLQKGSIQPKTEEGGGGGGGCQRERLKSPREQMITELAAALKPASKTRTCKDGGAGGGGRRLSAIKQTGKAKTIVGRISPEAKTKSTTKRPKTRPKSCPKSRGKVGGGAVLPNKSFGPKRAPKCAAGEQGPPPPPPGKTNVQETAPGGGNTIIILGSPNDLAALELLKSLMKQINASPEAAAKQPQPMQQQQSPSPTGVDAAGSEEVVTDQSQLEELYDAMYELTNNVNTMHDSYEQIIASLVSLQRRRIKTTKKEKAATATATATAGTLIPASASTIATLAKEAPAAGESTPTATPTDPTDISRFMDARTRADAFAELFATVDRLKEEMAPFYGCFDEAGYFSETAYAQNQITAGQRTSWLVQIRALNVTVEKLLAEYNREVLDMFRLTSTASSTG
ncbi:hypothetical protein TYRP_006629 [Tyrophagus putrescentiae]|nr:hypothetical protein TYRP_006629 [Tyrophagus putrescentiae]